MLLGEPRDLRDLRLRNLVGEDAADSLTFRVNLQHDPRGGVAVQREDLLEHLDHELHRSVVIVQQDDTVERRPFQLRLCLVGYETVVIANSDALVSHSLGEFYRCSRVN
jgi:hypothetical protein